MPYYVVSNLVARASEFWKGAEYVRIAIVDHALLTSACRQIEKWEGSQKRAAAQLGIGLGQFHRLRSGAAGKGLNGPVFRALYSYLPPEHASEPAVRRWERDLMSSLMTPEATSALDAYVKWLRRELARFGLRMDRQLHTVTSRDPPYEQAWRMLRHFMDRHLEAFARLERLTPEKGSPRFDKWRHELAYLRVVEPFLAPDGVELGWQQLEERGKLAVYLRTAVRREGLLLSREPDLQRAQLKGSPPLAADRPQDEGGQ